MPQMAPMLWSLLYFYPILLITLCTIILNSNKSFSLKSMQSMSSKWSKKNWSW